MNRYLKFAAQVVASVAVALVAALVDDRIDASEWRNAGIVALGAVAVLGAGNLPAGVWAHTKTYVSAASAAMVLWQSLAFAGMTAAEWIQVALAAAGALGVYALRGPVVYGADDLGRAASGLADGPR